MVISAESPDCTGGGDTDMTADSESGDHDEIQSIGLGEYNTCCPIPL
jgi:hypothetical protein